MRFPSQKQAGTALVLTMMFIILLTLEAAMVSLLITRSGGEAGMLRGQNIAARRASETAISALQTALHQELQANSDVLAAFNKYKRGGSVTTYSNLTDRQTINPVSGSSENTDILSSAWIQEYRGNYFHLVGRAQYGRVDILNHKWVRLNPCSAGGGGCVIHVVAEQYSLSGL